MEDTFHQQLQSHQLRCYEQLHTQLSDLQLAPVLSYYRHAQRPRAPLWKLSMAIDVGCEFGQVSNRLASFSDRVLAVDLAPQMIEQARLLYPLPNVHYEVCSAESLTSKYRHRKADLVLAAMAGHFFDVEQFYSEARRCLRPEGVVAVVGFWSRGFSVGNSRKRHLFDHFVERQVLQKKDAEMMKAATKVMSLYNCLSLPAASTAPIERLHKKVEVEWSREDVAGYLFANRHILGGENAAIEEFVDDEVFDEPRRYLLHVFGWMWQV